MFIRYREICHARLIERNKDTKLLSIRIREASMERADSIIARAGTHNAARAYATELVNRNFSWITLYTDSILYLSILST